MDINDVVNPVNVSSRASVTTGNTPPFIKEWIDRPSTPMPSFSSSPSSSPPGQIVRQAPSLSTMTLLPGVPLVADTSYDSQFWARIFDLEFSTVPDMTELFFPSEESGDTEEMEDRRVSRLEDGASAGGGGGLFSSGMGETSTWRSTAVDGRRHSGSAAAGEGIKDHAPASAIGGSAIWSAISGPIGSSGGAGEGWPRVSPY